MDWTPDQIHDLARALQERAERGRLAELTPRTARLVAEALRRYAVEAFTSRGKMMIIEVADFRHGHGLGADIEAAWAVFDILCRRRPEAPVTLRKRE